MIIPQSKNIVLFCPKCYKKYEDTVQRFCLTDGSRLVPAPKIGKAGNQTNDVFTHLINRKAEAETDKFDSAPRFSKTNLVSLSNQRSASIGTIFSNAINAETEVISSPIEPTAEIEIATVIETNSETDLQPEIAAADLKPVPRFITPWEIPKSQAPLGNRKTNPAGREALTWANPAALFEQTIKGRYFVTALIGEDEGGLTYLAEDKILSGKKVVVRILMDEDADDSFTNKIFAEERVSLSHVNHPNIASVIDSGALSEGKPFLITEFVAGKSVKELLENAEQFDVQRIARIIRQASYALSEVHQSGVLHRNLKPENIVLATNESGAEQVKLISFGASKGKLSEENLPYKSPEQLAGKPANFASDGYSLAVIAFEMLTNQMPFKAKSVGKLLKAQREGLKIEPTKLRLELPSAIDKILEKALAFSPSDRYPKVRDFGDAFFNAISESVAANLWELEKPEKKTESPIPMPTSLLDSTGEKSPATVFEIENPVPLSADSVETNLEENESQVKEAKDFIQETRLPITPDETGSKRALFAVFGATILLLGIWGIWYYFSNHSGKVQAPVFNSTEVSRNTNQTLANALPVNTNPPLALEEIEPAPLPRSIVPPPNTNYFQNNRANLKGDTAQNFLGFSLYYPKDWKLNSIEADAKSKARGKFIDISKNAPSGTPIEQLMISYYDSNGTFKTDADVFARQVSETNETLGKIIPNYQMVSEGEKTINNGWHGYEVKFKGTGKTAAGEKITLWGKRLFIPAAIRGLRNGYVITILATSLSKEITGIDEVGVKGEVPNILYTFEPNQTF